MKQSYIPDDSFIESQKGGGFSANSLAQLVNREIKKAGLNTSRLKCHFFLILRKSDTTYYVKKSTAYKLWTRWGHWDELKRKIKSCPLKKQWFVTLTYNKHHRITDISHESARNHLVGFGRYLARKTKSHIELYAVYGDNHSPSNNGNEPEPHIHLIISSDAKIELWQIIDAWKQPPSPEQIKRKKEQGDVDPYGLVSRGWVEADEYDYTKEDECLTYLFNKHLSRK